MTKPQSMLHSCHSSKMQFKSLQVKQLPTNQAGDQSALICKFDNSTLLVRRSNCFICVYQVPVEVSDTVQSTSPGPSMMRISGLCIPTPRTDKHCRYVAAYVQEMHSPKCTLSLTSFRHQSGSQCNPNLYHLGLPWPESKGLAFPTYSSLTAHSLPQLAPIAFLPQPPACIWP